MSKSRIDRDYVERVTNRKKQARIIEINHLLSNMNDKQLENVHTYALNEYAEPDHEAFALEAVMKAGKEEHG